MAKKNGVEYKVNLVPSIKYSIKCPYSMVAKKVTIHETDNNASAANEVAYMISNNNQTSFHVGIDEKEAVQGLPFNRNGWHAGDGGNGYGNRNTIGFEICKNYKTGVGTNIGGTQLQQYNQAKANAVKVVAQVMIEQGINGVPGNVKTHQDWSGKLCPQKMLREGLWIPMRDQIIAEWTRLKTGKTTAKPAAPSKPTTSKPSTPSKPTTSKPKQNPWGTVSEDGKWGPGFTKALQKYYGSGTADGVISGQTKSKANEHVYAAKWGKGGSNLIRVFQMRLKGKGWYNGAIDGNLGPGTVKALQKAFGTSQDGVISPTSSLVKAMQKALNANKMPF